VLIECVPLRGLLEICGPACLVAAVTVIAGRLAAAAMPAPASRMLRRETRPGVSWFNRESSWVARAHWSAGATLSPHGAELLGASLTTSDICWRCRRPRRVGPVRSRLSSPAWHTEDPGGRWRQPMSGFVRLTPKIPVLARGRVATTQSITESGK